VSPPPMCSHHFLHPLATRAAEAGGPKQT
jgi:hypothetical protein